MTKPSLSWIDRGHVASLVDQCLTTRGLGGAPSMRLPPTRTLRADGSLLTSSSSAAARRNELRALVAGGGTSPRAERTSTAAASLHGRGASPSAHQISSVQFRSAPPPAPAETGGPPSAALESARLNKRVEVPDFQGMSGILEDRITAFLNWTVETLNARAAFIADEGGLSLGDRGELGDLAAVSTSVFHLLDEYRRELPEFEVARVLLDMVRPDGVLHIVVARTHLGRFGVGVLCGDALGKSAMAALEQGLVATLSE